MGQPLVHTLQQGDEVVTNHEIVFRVGIVPEGIKGVITAIANEFIVVDFSLHYGKKCIHWSEVNKCV